jgi:endonuclease/exonuclease/phosphatase family metal-dependent hydrolase
MQMLCKLIQQDVPAQAALVVAGDFNDWRQRAHSQLAVGANLREVFVENFGKPAKTFPARMPLLRLDRIYVRNAVGHAPVVLPNRPWTHLSDHAPLAAEIEI